MASLNKVMLIGNLTRDIDMRTTPAGLAIAKFGLAVNRRYTTAQGEQREEVTFIDIDAFGKQAETLAKYCRKGSPLYVEGRLKLDQWEDKNSGEKRSKLAVVLEGFQFLGGGGGRTAEGEQQGEPQADAPRTHRAPPAPAPDSVGQVDDDVPF